MRVVLLILVAAAGRLMLIAASPARNPVLVELFTSDGCTECPEADRLLQRLDAEQPIAGAELVVLAEHVETFNGLGWRDAFALPLFAERQRDYARLIGGGMFVPRSILRSMGGDRVDKSPNPAEIYTPEIVIDGAFGFAGSDWGDAQKSVRDALSLGEKGVIRVETQRVGRDTRVTMRMEHPPDGILFLAIAHEAAVSRVSSGMNAGLTLSHVAVVYTLREIGGMTAAVSGFERSVAEKIQPESRIVVLVAKPPDRNVDDAVTLARRGLRKGLRGSGVGRVTAIGVAHF